MSNDPRKPPKIEPYPHIFFIEGAGLLEPHEVGRYRGKGVTMSMTREELDDAAAGARDVARVTKATFDAFVEAGFTESQALRLAAEWLQATIQLSNDG